MAETVNSVEVENVEGKPQEFNRPENFGGRVRTLSGVVSVAITELEGAGDKIRLVRVPADFIIRKVRLGNDALDTGSAMRVDIGLDDLDGNVKDIDVYVDNTAQLHTAAKLTDQVEARDHALLNNRVFEDAGDTEADHDAEYYIVAAIATPATGGALGNLSYSIDYVLD